MAKITGLLTCKATGAKFQYRGFGRPPLFCPAEAKRRQTEQRKRAQAKVKKDRKAAKVTRKAA